MRTVKTEYKKEDAVYISKSNINDINKLDWHQWFKFNCVVCGQCLCSRMFPGIA